ncbi:MAG TPA: Fmu (Sun) domain protein, partial [Flavisolibacter sp.]|nr:Fmu (Sun) domain protein [Flavisolibacter sp.]
MSRALPENFLKSLDGLPGFDLPAFVAAHEARGQLTSIRLNPAKKGGAEAVAPGSDAANAALPSL